MKKRNYCFQERDGEMKTQRLFLGKISAKDAGL